MRSLILLGALFSPALLAQTVIEVEPHSFMRLPSNSSVLLLERLEIGQCEQMENTKQQDLRTLLAWLPSTGQLLIEHPQLQAVNQQGQGSGDIEQEGEGLREGLQQVGQHHTPKKCSQHFAQNQEFLHRCPSGDAPANFILTHLNCFRGMRPAGQ